MGLLANTAKVPKPPANAPTGTGAPIMGQTFNVEKTAGLPADTTIKIMEKAVQDAEDPQIYSLARWLVRQVAPPNKFPIVGRISEIAAIDAFVQKMIRYTFDPRTSRPIELVHRPSAMLQRVREYGRWAEDCESRAGLTITLLMCLGHRVRLTIVGFRKIRRMPGFDRPQVICNRGRYTHIFVESKIPRVGWVLVDPTRSSNAQAEQMCDRICTYRHFYPEQLEM